MSGYQAKPERRNWLSSNGYLLAYQGPPRDKPVLTVELRDKWYDLWVVTPGLDVIEFDYNRYVPKNYTGSEWCDHCPHPEWWDAVVEQFGFWDDDCSRQLVLGRYMDEVVGVMLDGVFVDKRTA